jgi:NADH:ubiquinone reductase (non-electrogenic)
VTVVSPETTSPYTPLLASAACGLFNFSLAEEPIRHRSSRIRLLQARVDDIDFERKVCVCNPAFPSLVDRTFEVTYDVVVVAPGCETNTFDTPGVAEHGLFLRNVTDAMAVRQRLSDVLEMASLPNIPDHEQRALLHILIVGGGPTGVEVAAEISDLVRNDLMLLYPDVANKITVAIHDVATQIMSVFDQKLAEHALTSFRNHEVDVKTGSHIIRVDVSSVYTKEDGEIKYGMLIWAAGNKQVSLVDRLKVSKRGHLPRILTDSYLRALGPDGTPVPDVYAIGDAADVLGGELPTTAEVACQKGEYLAKALATGRQTAFNYKQKALIAYTGQHDGVISGKRDWTGPTAWVAWRSKNLMW